MDKSSLLKPNKCQVNWTDLKVLLFDCDGVLTDGRIIYGNDAQDIKHFHAHDGMGFNLLKYTEITVGFISGRSSEALIRRCKDLQIKHLYQNVANKLECLDKILIELGLGYRNVVYMGDDWNDIPIMRKVAFSAAPADAQPDVAKIADWVSAFKGGRGAVRDLINHVLIHKGIYEKTILHYLDSIS